MALSQASASLAFSLHNSGAVKVARITNHTSAFRVHGPHLAGSHSTFTSGSPLLPLNLRMTRGGGRSGNRAAASKVQKKATAYQKKATAYQPNLF